MHKYEKYNKAISVKNTANKTIKGRPKTVPITGLYIVPMDSKSNATPNKHEKISVALLEA